MYDSAVTDKKITIDGIFYVVTDISKEYIDSRLIHTVKLKNKSEEYPLNINEDKLFSLNQILRRNEQNLVEKIRKQEKEKSKIMSDELRALERSKLFIATESPFSKSSILERENKKLKNKITLLRILAVGVPIVTFLIGLAIQL